MDRLRTLLRTVTGRKPKKSGSWGRVMAAFSGGFLVIAFLALFCAGALVSVGRRTGVFGIPPSGTVALPPDWPAGFPAMAGARVVRVDVLERTADLVGYRLMLLTDGYPSDVAHRYDTALTNAGWQVFGQKSDVNGSSLSFAHETNRPLILDRGQMTVSAGGDGSTLVNITVGFVPR